MTRVTHPDAFDEALDVDPDEVDVEPRGIRLDAWWQRIKYTPGWRWGWNWGAPLAVTALAAILRLWDLGFPHQLVFDETYYVKDSWSTIHLGYEGTWGSTPNPGFESGSSSGVNAYTSSPEFVAHPPLGKWIIGAGEALFGVQTAFGWRIATAVVGILAVVLAMWVIKRLFGSQLIALIGGFLFAIEGNAIVLSRVALLDNTVMFLAFAGVACVLLDREWHRRRLERWIADRMVAGRTLGSGPAMWWRPWLVAAGALFGFDAATKWSGFYFLGVFACYVLLTDVLARRRAKLPDWQGSIVKQGAIDFVLTVPVALAAYLASYSGWLLTKGGWDRSWVEQDPTRAWGGALGWVPRWFQDLWHYQTEMYGFDINLHTPHAYMSQPISWPIMLRPTSMYWMDYHDGTIGAINDLANPLIWWGGTAAVAYLIYRAVRFREWQSGFILAGYGAGWLPWVLFYSQRTIFTFYSIAFEPYLILAIAAAVRQALGSPDDPRRRRSTGFWWVGVLVVLAIALTVFFWPIWTGERINYFYWLAHMWFPSWI